MSSQLPNATTARVTIRPQTIREAYDPPANVTKLKLEIKNLFK